MKSAKERPSRDGATRVVPWRISDQNIPSDPALNAIAKLPSGEITEAQVRSGGIVLAKAAPIKSATPNEKRSLSFIWDIIA